MPATHTRRHTKPLEQAKSRNGELIRLANECRRAACLCSRPPSHRPASRCAAAIYSESGSAGTGPTSSSCNGRPFRPRRPKRRHPRSCRRYPMRIAIYGRVSTSHQVEHQTIEQQLARLVAHVGAHAAEGWALDPAHVFRDDGYSGAALVRPGLDRLRDAVKGREVDRVLVTAPDRLARNYVHQMVLLEEWARLGCAGEGDGHGAARPQGPRPA